MQLDKLSNRIVLINARDLNSQKKKKKSVPYVEPEFEAPNLLTVHINQLHADVFSPIQCREIHFSFNLKKRKRKEKKRVMMIFEQLTSAHITLLSLRSYISTAIIYTG